MNAEPKILRTSELLPPELLNGLLELSTQLEKASVDYGESAYEYANADHDYRRAKAMSYLKAVTEDKPKPRREQRTIPAIEATRDIECEPQRLAERLARAHKEACKERVESARAQMSAYQTVVNALRAELELAGRGPQR